MAIVIYFYAVFFLIPYLMINVFGCLDVGYRTQFGRSTYLLEI